MNTNSKFRTFGTEAIKIEGKNYLVFKFAKKSDPDCCPSLNVAVSNQFDEYGNLELKKIFYTWKNENDQAFKWKKIQ